MLWDKPWVRIVTGFGLLALIWSLRPAYQYLNASSMVSMSIKYDRDACESVSYPVSVRMYNRSSRVMYAEHIYLEARRPGHSRNVYEFACGIDDHIVLPGQVVTACWAPPKGVEEPENLRYRIDHFNVWFQ